MTTFFALPQSSVVDKVVPKNSFDGHTTSRQKKLLSEFVERIRWTHKLSPSTVNLSGTDVKEIEVFEITLKKKGEIADVITVIDRAISYPIIFIVRYGDEAALFSSQKHPHPVDENKAVVDWTFSSGWLAAAKAASYSIELKKDLDSVFQDFCRKLSGRPTDNLAFKAFIDRVRRLKELNAQILLLRTEIKNCKQFNKKVELNVQLQSLLRELEEMEQS